jgi:acyl dehydratase
MNVEAIRGAELAPAAWRWDAKTVILYHLGIGAGVPATAESELTYTYEAALKVLPTFGVLPAFPALRGMFSLEGVKIKPMMVLHGEQDLVIKRPLPIVADVSTTARVADVYDKGTGAVVVVEATTSLEDGEVLCTNRFSSFIRGEGGFGGESGPPPGNLAPERNPDLVVESPTMPQQALLYRLSGDDNPIHADPAMAARAGFDRPILHGLCSFGITCKAVVDAALEGDVGKVGRFQARFAGVVFPGETLVTSMWIESSQIVISTQTKERDTPVISNAAITTNP